MASLATSWPNRIRSGFVCDDLHVTHAGSNVEMARGNVSLVLLKDGREVQCYEPGQLYEGIGVLNACCLHDYLILYYMHVMVHCSMLPL